MRVSVESGRTSCRNFLSKAGRLQEINQDRHHASRCVYRSMLSKALRKYVNRIRKSPLSKTRLY